MLCVCFFFFKQKTAYEMRISDWSSDVCSSDLFLGGPLTELPMGVLPEAVLTASEGEFSYIYTEALPNDVPGHWRAQFDLTVEGDKPVDLRRFLRSSEERRVGNELLSK